MKPWAELTAGARGARVGGVVAVVVAILWGVSTLRGGPHRGPDGDGKPAVTEAEDKAEAKAEPGAEAEAAPKADTAAEAPAAAETAAAAPEPEPAPAAEAAAEPAAEANAAAPAEAAAEPAPAEETAAADAPALPAAPTLDVVRIEQDGSAVIAGKGAPGSTLSLRVDGAEVIAIPADASGNFVGMFSLPPSDAARALSVVMVMADGTEIPAGSTVAIAATVAPVIAQAEPTEPAATTTETAAADTAATETQSAEPAAPPAALMVTDAGAKVLQGIGDGTVAAANVTVDAISYTPEGAVVLAGRGTAGALVRLYLDNAATGEASVAEAGDWSVTLADIKPGIYTLRVDQLDASGNVTSRFETPFKRESLEALAAATAPAPAAEATETAAAPAAEPAATETATEPAATETAAAPASEPAAETATADTAAAEPAPAEAATSPEPAAPAAAEAPAAVADAEPAPEGTAEPAATEVASTESPAAPAATAPAPIQITVQPGYTLWRIARENLGDGIMYVQVFEANKDQIRDPDLIYPGQIFTLKKAE